MPNSEIQNQRLLPAPTQQAEINGQGVRPSRAYKVAGLTLLACVLIVGQATIAYFLFSQQGDIKSLKVQNENLNSKLSNGRSVAGSVRMHIPMNTFPKLLDLTTEEDSTEVQEKKVPREATQCHLEAAGVKPVEIPGFQPNCDERGLYRAQQCFLESCWCVDTATGQEISGSLTKGLASCDAPVFTAGSRGRMMRMPDVAA
ncbi:hypothetical protein CgunFtcFv8_016752 [Champsocephalus gunnari]|uniref:Thyroglobulin type-1 domain-containing protein n=1 Tax=Champsocephalus gunnari TaxID=52237 RepID=A0AAN8HAG1_CHAGU|nr:hypothetical protein CgunFtcFv8_016752 [Champsocephalus gunnari]